uniref:Prolyl 4-hydroxylase N-terminal domain-containing protein n=1 Tax=Equus asinus TaxID=9793 RepID=A0A9L0JNS4_EQUAS
MKLQMSILAWISFLGCTWAEIFTSAGHMANLISEEKQLVQALKEYILLNEAKLSMIKSWTEKRDALNLIIPEDKEDLGKLVDVYKVLKHLNKDWSLVESFILQDPCIGFISGLSKLFHRFFFPTEEDDIQAAKALLLLQHTYKLDLKALSKGVLAGKQYPWVPFVNSCFKIALLSFRTCYFIL